MSTVPMHDCLRTNNRDGCKACQRAIAVMYLFQASEEERLAVLSEALRASKEFADRQKRLGRIVATTTRSAAEILAGLEDPISPDVAKKDLLRETLISITDRMEAMGRRWIEMGSSHDEKVVTSSEAYHRQMGEDWLALAGDLRTLVGAAVDVETIARIDPEYRRREKRTEPEGDTEIIEYFKINGQGDDPHNPRFVSIESRDRSRVFSNPKFGSHVRGGLIDFEGDEIVEGFQTGRRRYRLRKI